MRNELHPTNPRFLIQACFYGLTLATFILCFLVGAFVVVRALLIWSELL